MVIFLLVICKLFLKRGSHSLSKFILSKSKEKDFLFGKIISFSGGVEIEYSTEMGCVCIWLLVVEQIPG